MQAKCNQREVVAASDTSSTSIPSSLSYFLPCEESTGSSMTLVNKCDLKTETEVVLMANSYVIQLCCV